MAVTARGQRPRGGQSSEMILLDVWPQGDYPGASSRSHRLVTLWGQRGGHHSRDEPWDGSCHRPCCSPDPSSPPGAAHLVLHTNHGYKKCKTCSPSHQQLRFIFADFPVGPSQECMLKVKQAPSAPLTPWDGSGLGVYFSFCIKSCAVVAEIM